MSGATDVPSQRAHDAVLAVALWAIDPAGLGGLSLRGPPDTVRDDIERWLPRLLPTGTPLVPVPVGISDERLLGGIALAETLRAGRMVREQGVLQHAHGGVVVARMAERMDLHVAAHLAAALDQSALAVERDGASVLVPTRFGVLVLDESGENDDCQVPRRLLDRIAFRIDLASLGRLSRNVSMSMPDAAQIRAARAKASLVAVPGSIMEAVVAAAAACGVACPRACLLCLAATRAHAAYRGQAVASVEDAEVAARLTLAWRATRIPHSAPTPGEPGGDGDTTDATSEAQSSDPHVDARESAPDDHDAAVRPNGPHGAQPHAFDEASASEACVNPKARPDSVPVDDILVAAIQSALPPGLLAELTAPVTTTRNTARSGRAGAAQLAMRGGRQTGVRRGSPGGGHRLHILETLRAAAPWQQLRTREAPPVSTGAGRRIRVHAEDFRLIRRMQRSETCVIFCVDASGSSALQRLAEVKGAIEHLLLDCYARRDHVALVAFRGEGARLVLPPMRSLTRVRRGLAALTGGGLTPLAAGIQAALTLAQEVSRRGQSPVMVLMTDGRANLSPDGTYGTDAATRAAVESAYAVHASGIPTLFLDTAPRPRDRARALAHAMNARYLPLPYVDAAGIGRHIHQLAATR